MSASSYIGERTASEQLPTPREVSFVVPRRD